jgi:hypothetical protein
VKLLAGDAWALPPTPERKGQSGKDRERTGTATPAASLWADAAHNPNPLIAQRFVFSRQCLGSADSAVARPNVRVRTARSTGAGMRLKHLSFPKEDGDRSGAAVHVLAVLGRTQRSRPSRLRPSAHRARHPGNGWVEQALAPFRRQVEESGLTDDELGDFFEEVREEVWQDKHGRPSQPS